MKDNTIGESYTRWPFETLGNDVHVKGRIGWKGYKTSDLRDNGPIVIGGSNVKSQQSIDYKDIKYLSREKYEESPEIKLKEGDVLLVTRGNSLGDAACVDKNLGEATINPTIIILSEFKGDSKFLFFYLISPQGHSNLMSISSGSSVPAIYQKDVKKLRYPKPPIPTQKAIAYILSTIDDKIELNRKMNETLESIAQAIFKSWFIDFDPVRANAEGRPTGFPPEISGLFPDEFVDSEIGEIPKGWAASTFADVLKIQGGFAFKSKDFGDEGHPVIKIKNIRGDGTVDQTDCDKISNVDKKLDRFLLNDGDCVIAMTGATVGKVGLMSIVDGKFYLNQRVGRLNPISASGNCWYSVLLLSSEKTKDFIENYAYGSAQPNISSKDIESIPNVTPSFKVREFFNEIVSPLFSKTLLIIKENDVLSELRDTLLPKLISGELRIPDAEKIAEKVL